MTLPLPRAIALWLRSPPSQTAPDRINWPIAGSGGLRKSIMHSDSRKAQHNSFAHYNSQMLSSTRHHETPASILSSSQLQNDVLDVEDNTDHRQVNAAILQFIGASVCTGRAA